MTLWAGGVLWLYRRRLRRATDRMVEATARAGADAPLAEWCRHMNLTVITHTGTVFATTFAELQASEAPTFRNWNVPVQATVWSDLAEPELTEDVRATAGKAPRTVSIGKPFRGFPRG
jgi:hypothetical protein